MSLEPTSLEPMSLGRFSVTGTAAEADAFRAATGSPSHDPAILPLTFPMRWLAAPAIRGAMTALVSDGVALVHEAQTFDYERPLRVDEPYTLSVSARRESDPDRLVLLSAITAEDGAPAARLETVLRLFPLDGSGVAGA